MRAPRGLGSALPWMSHGDAKDAARVVARRCAAEIGGVATVHEIVCIHTRSARPRLCLGTGAGLGGGG